MRYFLAKNASNVIMEKRVYAGDDSKADGLVAGYLTAHPDLTVQEVDQVTFDASIVVVDPAPSRTAAITELLTGTTDEAKLNRAILLVILDEVNVIRALLPGPPAARTVAQLKTAIQNKLNAGTAD